MADNESVQYSSDDLQLKQLLIMHNISGGLHMSVRHLHIQYELLFIKSGKVLVESNSDSVNVEGPCLIVHKPFTLHRVMTEEGTTYDRFVINFSKELLDRLRPWIPKMNVFDTNSLSILQLNKEMEYLLTDYFLKISMYLGMNERNKAELYLALCLATATDFAGDDNLAPTANDGYISDVVGYIGEHYAEKITLDQLTDQFYVSRAKLVADFKKETRMTIKQYITLNRINYAKTMLISGYSIADTAEKCGFYDESHFVYTFRSLTGLTPKSFINSGNSDINV